MTLSHGLNKLLKGKVIPRQKRFNAHSALEGASCQLHKSFTKLLCTVNEII